MAEITTISVGVFKIHLYATNQDAVNDSANIGDNDVVCTLEQMSSGSSGGSSGGASSFIEVDPVFVSHVAHSITQAMIDSWNAKSNLALGTTATTAAAGNHNHDGVYLKSYTEQYQGTVKKVNGQSPNSSGEVTITIPSAITETDVSGWGFIKGYTEQYTGTVKKVNNTSPDANGNVTISIPTVPSFGTTAGTMAEGNHTHQGYEGRLQSLESIVGAMATVYSGSSAPADTLGKDGDIYIQV